MFEQDFLAGSLLQPRIASVLCWCRGRPSRIFWPGRSWFHVAETWFFPPLGLALGVGSAMEFTMDHDSNQWSIRTITGKANIYIYIYIHIHIMLYCTCNIHIWLKYTHLTVTGASKNALGQCCKDRTWLNPHSHPLTFMNIHQLYIYIYI